MSYATPPILFLVFRRPRETELAFASIRQAKPKQLYIAMDGPRADHHDDVKRIQQVKEIVAQVDWDCKVEQLYRKTNLGLEKSVSSALDWFFRKVESGIVMEDDCVADPSFYQFAANMLDKYKHDERVMAINGSNFLPMRLHDPDKYYFSIYPHFWGWASWKRAWEKYDGEMKEWPKIKAQNKFATRYHNFWHKQYFETIIDSTYNRNTNSWGYRWFYSVWASDGICITPGVNLVKNIGFNKEATHPVIRKFELDTRAISTRPTAVKPTIHKIYDKLTADRYYAITPQMYVAQKDFYYLKQIYGKISK